MVWVFFQQIMMPTNSLSQYDFQKFPPSKGEIRKCFPRKYVYSEKNDLKIKWEFL